ncbi:MAG: peptidoglycan DD-metalloendopeptidase family protein [Magnetococcales bacterium]|nr:peptidoglycan DD-metalloendopeptidase family protein [Magnetococcales bacterium]
MNTGGERVRFGLRGGWLWIMLWSLSAWGASEIDNQEHVTLERGRMQLNRTVRELVREQQALGQAKGETLSLLEELEQLDRSLTDGERRQTELLARQGEALRLQPEIEARIQANREQLAKQRERLGRHLRLMYVLGGQGMARTLLSEQGLAMGRRGVVYYSRLIQARNQEFTEFRIVTARLRNDIAKGRELAVTLESLTANLTEEQKIRQVERAKRTDLLRRAREEEQLHQRKVEELTQAKQHLSSFLERLSGYLDVAEPETPELPARAGNSGNSGLPPERIKERRGHLPNPVPGKWEKRPPGLFYRVAANTPVTAIHAGDVVYADWFRGYGLLLIIKHGEHVYSLYGHNHRIRVAQGDRVRAGETIAESGDTGSLDGVPGLYFEMRVQGKTINPAGWLAGTG